MFTIDLSPVSVQAPAKSEPKKFIPSSGAVTEAAHDAALVERFKNGDEKAFEEIAARYRTKLYLTALGFLKDKSDAEEMAQDALIRAHRGLANFRGDSSLATWLHRVVSNLARNRYWHMKRRGAGCTLSLDYDLAEGSGETFSAFFSDEGPTASQEVSFNEFTVLVARCMEKLEPRHREILILRNVEELSYDEIAVKLNIAAGTVKSRIARARDFLGRKLSEECPDFGEKASPLQWFEADRGRNAHSIIAA